MKNGHNPSDDGKLEKRLDDMQRMLFAIAKELHLTKTGVMVLYGSVIDMSSMAGPAKKERMARAMKVVHESHEKEWNKLVKRRPKGK